MGNQCGCCQGVNTGELKSEEPVKHIELDEEDTVDVMKYPADDHRPNPDFATIIINYDHPFTKPQKVQMQKQKQFKFTEDEPEDKRLPELPEYYRLNDGSIYKGTWFHGLPHGKGKFYCEDHYYEGYVRDAGYHGLGRMILKNGDVYEGRFIEGDFEGKGKILYFESGLELIGNFKGGLLEGEGRETWPNLTSYSGNYKNGKKEGKGKLIYGVKVNKQKKKKKQEDEVEEEENKDEIIYVEEFYDGEWKDNMQHGEGVYQWVDGRKYEGKWDRGKMHGEGLFIWRDKKSYKGMYKNDMKNGPGTFYWSDDKYWIGHWKNGKREGKGTFYFNQQKRVGTWKDGRLLEWEAKAPGQNQMSPQGGEELDEAIDHRGEFDADPLRTPLSGANARLDDENRSNIVEKPSLLKQSSKQSEQRKPETTSQKNSKPPSRRGSRASPRGVGDLPNEAFENKKDLNSGLIKTPLSASNPLMVDNNANKSFNKQSSKVSEHNKGDVAPQKNSQPPSRKASGLNPGNANEDNIFASSHKNSRNGSQIASANNDLMQFSPEKSDKRLPEPEKEQRNLIDLEPNNDRKEDSPAITRKKSNPEENYEAKRELTDLEQDILNDREQMKF